MLKLNMKNFNVYTILSILFLLGGLLFWISWGLTYGVWYDIGVYSVTIIFVVAGIVGIIISLMETEEGSK